MALGCEKSDCNLDRFTFPNNSCHTTYVDSFKIDKCFVSGYEDIAAGVISTTFRTANIEGFNQHISSLKPVNRTSYTWFNEHWQERFECDLPSKTWVLLFDLIFFTQSSLFITQWLFVWSALNSHIIPFGVTQLAVWNSRDRCVELFEMKADKKMSLQIRPIFNCFCSPLLLTAAWLSRQKLCVSFKTITLNYFSCTSSFWAWHWIESHV